MEVDFVQRITKWVLQSHVLKRWWKNSHSLLPLFSPPGDEQTHLGSKPGTQQPFVQNSHSQKILLLLLAVPWTLPADQQPL